MRSWNPTFAPECKPVAAALLPIFLCLLAGGCGGSQKLSWPAITPNELPAAEAGSLEGTVFFDGLAPAPRQLTGMGAACQADPRKPILDERLLVAEGRLQNVFVSISHGLEQTVFRWRKQAVQMDQRGCVYRPHVIGVMCYQPVAFVNSDSLPHNVNTTGSKQSQGQNFSMNGPGGRRLVQFARPEFMLPVVCNVHPWMRAFINVVPHPCFAVTDKAGKFLIKGIPKGRYQLVAVHEKLGQKHFGPVEVRPGKTTKLPAIAFHFSR